MTPLEWYTPFVTMDIGLLEKVLRTVVVYLGIVLLLRLAGKRLLAQMNSLDLIVILLLSNVVQNAIIGPDNSVLGAMIGAVVLIGFDLALDWLTDRFGWLQSVVVGNEVRLIKDGRPDLAAQNRVGVDGRELARALRRQGVDDPRQVDEAYLEPAGELLIDLKPEARSVTQADLQAAVAELRELILARRGGEDSHPG